MAREYTKATHCKNCGEKFGDVVREGSNRLCKECYRDYQRMHRGYKSKREWREWNVAKRLDVYRERRDELMKLTEREDWLKVIRTNLETALTQIP